MEWYAWVCVGIVIGVAFEYSFWIYRCFKRNLFDEKGSLKSLK